jgi:hypothetical protein
LLSTVEDFLSTGLAFFSADLGSLTASVLAYVVSAKGSFLTSDTGILAGDELRSWSGILDWVAD